MIGGRIRCRLAIFLLALLVLVSLPVFAATQQRTSSAGPSATMRTIVLVRHGNYVEDPAIDPKIGPHLSPLGVAQAHLAGARLAQLPVRFGRMVVSPMQRAEDTAAIIGADFPGRHFDIDQDLAECTPPTRRREIIAHERPADLAACQAQIDRVFARYFKPASGPGQDELIVCHGDVIRYLVTRALGVDTRAWLEMSVGHASITTIRVEADGRFKVIDVGDVGYMPPNMLSGATGDSERSLAIPPLPKP